VDRKSELGGTTVGAVTPDVEVVTEASAGKTVFPSSEEETEVSVTGTVA